MPHRPSRSRRAVICVTPGSSRDWLPRWTTATSCPSRRSSPTTNRPMNPVPPMTSVRMSRLSIEQIEAIVLSRQGESLSLFQKFLSMASRARFAIVLLSADDYGVSRTSM